MSDEYLTTSELCIDYLVAPRTAARWRTTGEGPPFVRIGPRKVIYRKADIEAWLAGRTYQHRAAEHASASKLSTRSEDPSRSGQDAS